MGSMVTLNTVHNATAKLVDFIEFIPFAADSYFQAGYYQKKGAPRTVRP
jgi:hypothetical protein